MGSLVCTRPQDEAAVMYKDTLRFLIVDDQPFVRRLLFEVFCLEGYSFLIAAQPSGYPLKDFESIRRR